MHSSTHAGAKQYLCHQTPTTHNVTTTDTDPFLKIVLQLLTLRLSLTARTVGNLAMIILVVGVESHHIIHRIGQVSLIPVSRVQD